MLITCRYHDTIERYCDETDMWEIVGEMPTSRSWLSCVSLQLRKDIHVSSCPGTPNDNWSGTSWRELARLLFAPSSGTVHQKAQRCGERQAGKWCLELGTGLFELLLEAKSSLGFYISLMACGVSLSHLKGTSLTYMILNKWLTLRAAVWSHCMMWTYLG